MNDVNFNFSNKNIIVTGGAMGIGKTVAEELARSNAGIAIWDLNIKIAKQTAKDISDKYDVKCIAYHCDVTDVETVKKVMQETLNDFISIDGLFNNAGIGIHKAAIDLTPEDWRKIIDVNLNGVFWVAQTVGKYFIDNNIKGSIVNTASMSAHIVNVPQKQVSYNSSKAAVLHLTKSLAVEWVGYGIRVNSISPGYIYTEMTSGLDEELLDTWIDAIPFDRMGKPEELTGAVLYLLSDASSYMSGSDLIIDGCFTCI